MQFTHFDGSLTPVPSISDALRALQSRERQFITQQETLAYDDLAYKNSDRYAAEGTERTTVLDKHGNFVDAEQPVFDEHDNRDVYSDWNATEYGFYRDDVTRRYHAKLLNVFRTNDGTLSVGSVRITRREGFGCSGSMSTVNSNSWEITARCVKCKAVLELTDRNFYARGDAALWDYDLDLMQQFTRKVIAHGHNHSASWVSKTPVTV